MPIEDKIERLRRLDSERPNLPGEHWVVLGLGALLLWKSASGRSFVGRALAGALGTALIGRAASGTGGVARVADMLRGRSRVG